MEQAGAQATVFAEITENTLQAIPGITDPGQDGYHDTSTQTSTGDTAPMWDLGGGHPAARPGHAGDVRLRHLGSGSLPASVAGVPAALAITGVLIIGLAVVSARLMRAAHPTGAAG